MSKRILIILIAILWSLPLQAQGANWSAWLYDSDTGRMFRVDENGATLEDFILPSVIGHTQYSFNVAVSRNGNLIAYTVLNPDMNVSQFLIYDTVSDNLVTSYSPGRILGDTLDMVPGEQIFNQLDNVVAYSYLTESGWEIVLLNIPNNEITFSLRSDSPAIRAYNPDGFNFMIPAIQEYTGSDVHFTMIPFGTEGPLTNESYVWNLLTNAVSPTNRYPSPTSDRFAPTGEIVMPTFNERLPNRLETLPFPFQLNAIEVYDPSLGGRFPMFTVETWSFGATNFVQNGERILAAAFDVTSDNVQFPLLERNGALVSNLAINTDSSQSVRGTADGFVYTSNTTGAGGNLTALLYVQTRNAIGAPQLVWVAPAGIAPHLVWAKDNRTGLLPTAYTPWQPLLPPSTTQGVSPAELPTATPFGLGSPVLSIGGIATVNTTEGDNLNMRSGPGTSFEIVERVANGTRVTLVEGPRPNEGFTWWRVRLINGVEGWVVDAADGISTLIPSR